MTPSSSLMPALSAAGRQVHFPMVSSFHQSQSLCFLLSSQHDHVTVLQIGWGSLLPFCKTVFSSCPSLIAVWYLGAIVPKVWSVRVRHGEVSRWPPRPEFQNVLIRKLSQMCTNYLFSSPPAYTRSWVSSLK